MTGAVKPRESDTSRELFDRNREPESQFDIGFDLTKSGSSELGESVRYLAGTTLDCPLQRVDVRHVAFHRYTGGNPDFTDEKNERKTINDARRLGAHRWGGFVNLREAQYKAVLRDIYDPTAGKKEDAVTKWIRPAGGRIWRVVSRLSPSWKGRQDGDMPLGWFLYLVPADGMDFSKAENADWPTIIKRPEGFSLNVG